MVTQPKGTKLAALKRKCSNCEFFLRALSGPPRCGRTCEPTEPTDLCGGHQYRQSCRVCGCSHHDPCPEGCWWVESDLCSSCQVREK